MRQQTRELALASVLGALAVLFLFLGGVLPLALYACPLLASACLLPVREECRASYQWRCFFAAAILGLLLGPDKESALLFCFLGYYPLLQPSLDAIGSRALRFLTKLGLYVLAAARLCVPARRGDGGAGGNRPVAHRGDLCARRGAALSL